MSRVPHIFVAFLLLSAATTRPAAAACASVVHLLSSPNPAVQGSSVTFLVGVTAPVGCTIASVPTGMITVSDASAVLGSVNLDQTGAGMLVIATLTAGAHTINAMYSGDSNYMSGSAQALIQTILASSTSTSTVLASSTDPSLPGQGVTFTAAISPHQASVGGLAYRPTGSVTFTDGAVPLGSAAVVNGAGTFSLNSATLSVPSLNVGFHSIQAVYSGDSVFSASVSPILLQVTAMPGQFPSVSAASLAPTASLAASMIAAGFGQALTTATVVAPPTPPLPTTLGGITVTVTDTAGTSRACPLWFVSPTQINYYIPDGSQAGPATVTVANQTQTVATASVLIDSVAPGLFSMNANGQGVAAGIAIWAMPDGTQTWQYIFQCEQTAGSCVSVPLDMSATTAQLYLELFGTGIRGRSSLSAVTARIGGVDVPVQYAGPVAGLTGVDQVNMPVPASLIGRGEASIVLTVDSKTANAVTVNLK